MPESGRQKSRLLSCSVEKPMHRAIAWACMSFRAMTKNIGHFVFTALLLAVFATPVHAQIKLYLKDGSYQLVKSYQIEGDRVRYYSLDRSQWEEVPLSLVDFTATQAA